MNSCSPDLNSRCPDLNWVTSELNFRPGDLTCRGSDLNCRCLEMNGFMSEVSQFKSEMDWFNPGLKWFMSAGRGFNTDLNLQCSVHQEFKSEARVVSRATSACAVIRRAVKLSSGRTWSVCCLSCWRQHKPCPARAARSGSCGPWRPSRRPSSGCPGNWARC